MVDAPDSICSLKGKKM